jgi:DNA-binding transcriptional MocR family regulator
VKKSHAGGWKPDVRGGGVRGAAGRAGKPVYLAIVEAIEDDIRAGKLNLTDRLPAQRELAKALDLNYATVSRAYTEAQRRGLIYSRVGQGTFICKPRTPRGLQRGAGRVDMTMNLPPEPDDPQLEERMTRGLRALDGELRGLLRYQEFGGSDDARESGVRWLARRGLALSADCLLVCPGAQTALLAVVSLLAKTGDVVLCEELTYPGLRAVAAQLGVRLVGLPMDAEGIEIEAFRRAAVEHHPKALYSNPTFLNPTTHVISHARRSALVALARQYGIPIIEDDAYGLLPESTPPAFAELAPELTFHVSGFAKFLGAGLRVAYLVAPDARRASRLSTSLRALSVMASPLTVALATQWVDDGTAEAALLAVRAESVERQRIVRRVLASARYLTQPEAFHLWLSLPAPWTRAAFASHLRGHDVHVAVSDAFSVAEPCPEAVRVCLGGDVSRADITRVLELIADALEHPASTSSSAFF